METSLSKQSQTSTLWWGLGYFGLWMMKTQWWVMENLKSKQPQSISRLTHDWCNQWKATWGAQSSNDSSVRAISRVACDLANLRDVLINRFCVFPSFLYPYYKNPHYPRNCKECFREKTLKIQWRVSDCIPTILYTFLLIFFTFFPL